MSHRVSFRRGLSLRKLIAVAVVIGIGVLLIWGFVEGRVEATRKAERDAPLRAPQRVSSQNGSIVITIDGETQRRSGIETAAAAPTPYKEQVRAYAAVLDLGPLTDLSNGYVNAGAQLDTVEAKVAVSKMAFERAARLYQDQHISLAQLQAAEATFRGDQAALAAAQSQVRTLAASAQQQWGPVLARSLTRGSTMITRLIERQDFLLQVSLAPGVSLAAPPLTATIQTGTDARATIAYVSPATRTDPRIQGVSFFYTAPAESGVLPGMNLLAFLPSGRTVQGVTIPASAIVWWQDRAWVYRRTGADSFTRTEIPTELPAPGGGYVVKEAAKKTEIVTQGAQSLLSEEFRAQIQVGED
jgi:hypothetical protein